jgi:3',5'-cyclic AMP phosphodiesterase CpdA
MTAVKLAFTADLHLPITKSERLTGVAQEIAGFHPDALVIAGDLGETIVDFQRCLGLFKDRLACPIWVLAGNHDLWMQRAIDSHTLWVERLPQAVDQAGCHWLEGTSFVLHGTAVAGTIAWYDYSAADPSIQASEMHFAQEKYNYNADALRIDWEWSDPEFAARVAGPFVSTLDRLEADPAVRRTIVVTHVPLLEGQMPRDPSNRDWAFSNAYFGNLTLGKKVLARPKVSHIISGHTHMGRECQAPRSTGAPVEACVLASDYERPGWRGLTFQAEG